MPIAIALFCCVGAVIVMLVVARLNALLRSTSEEVERNPPMHFTPGRLLP